MTVEEIFSKIGSHMKQGLVYHEEFARAYDYLYLRGYARCQDYHYMEESCSYRYFSHYYATHYFKLLVIENTEPPKIIPETWYKYTTKAVDTGTKRNAVKELMEKWVEWEQSTKKLYQEMRQELIAIGEVAAALYIDTLIEDVTKELRHAEKQYINLETIGYDIVEIIDAQEALYKKYTKKLGW